MNARKLFKISLVTPMIAYSSFIEVKYSTNQITESFSAGSADNLIMDNLRSGDIVLFHHRWYHYHIPTAVIIKFYQFIHNCDYDHAGIIVQDEKTGVPYLLQNTPFQCYKLKRFDETILSSNAHRISIIKFNPVIQPTSNEEKGFRIHVQKLLQNTHDYKYMQAFIYYFYLFGSYFLPIQRPKNCYNTSFLFNALSHYNIFYTPNEATSQVKKHVPGVSLKDFNHSKNVSIYQLNRKLAIDEIVVRCH